MPASNTRTVTLFFISNHPGQIYVHGRDALPDSKTKDRGEFLRYDFTMAFRGEEKDPYLIEATATTHVSTLTLDREGQVLELLGAHFTIGRTLVFIRAGTPIMVKLREELNWHQELAEA